MRARSGFICFTRLLHFVHNDKAVVIARSVATRQSMAMRSDFQPAVYIMANHKGGTIYCGVTSNLVQRAAQHRESQIEGFTQKYGCKRLVWFELHSTMEYAITREKQLKAGSRRKKVALIEEANPDWRDRFLEIAG